MSRNNSAALPDATKEAPVGPMSKSTSVSLLIAILIVAFAVVPLVGSEYWLNAILVPFLIMSLAGLGLNITMGYCGQASLGSGAFMAVGAYATYNILVRLPDLPLPVSALAGCLIAGLVGIVVGLPSLRIKGFYLIATTLAAQFFIEWVFRQFPWFSNYASSVSAPKLAFLGVSFDTPVKLYLLTLTTVVIVFAVSWKLVCSQTGRNWMATRDMELAAATIGVPTGRAKLSAFFFGAMILGLAGALLAFVYLRTINASSFSLDQSFVILFIVVIGGMSSLSGNFLGAAFVILLPTLIEFLAGRIFSGAVDSGQLANARKVLFGVMIIWFLIKEPYGLAALLDRIIGWFRMRLSR
ncbi:branched-chain amino acid ABC transporter permease [Hoeflea sp. Naph1]|uniref:branched-chain amino acid ABC transporter permease n=1 Tax=Hoeflea sp. Naph1 TaxID=3388653 RepID=UPI00398F9B21